LSSSSGVGGHARAQRARPTDQTNREFRRQGPPAHRWTKDGVLRVLRNPVYAGFMACGGDLHPAEHSRLIERPTFDRVQHLLGCRIHPASIGENPAYVLRGLLRCSCGYAMSPASTRKGKYEYRYYRCVRREKQGRDACGPSPCPPQRSSSTSSSSCAQALARRVGRRGDAIAPRTARHRACQSPDGARIAPQGDRYCGSGARAAREEPGRSHRPRSSGNRGAALLKQHLDHHSAHTTDFAGGSSDQDGIVLWHRCVLSLVGRLSCS
jgi:hypothetical protein